MSNFPITPIAITMGDPSGIGPEIIVKAFMQEPELTKGCFVVGDVSAMRRAAGFVKSGHESAIKIESILEGEIGTQPAHHVLRVLQIGEQKKGVFDASTAFEIGKISAKSGKAAADAVVWAARAALKGRISALVTAPLHKEALALAGVKFPGHTELLQAEAAAFLGIPIKDVSEKLPVRMMLANEELKTVLVSIHMSLRDAIEAVSYDNVLETIRITRNFLHRTAGTFVADSPQNLQAIGQQKPRQQKQRQRIAVAGLNPHAGEGGLFGREEIDIISPAIAAAQKEGIDVVGPFAPDTVFMRARDKFVNDDNGLAHKQLGEFDAVIAMYHDQGLIPVKYLGVEQGVNVTLGLPLVRTSPDHGTAFDIAGRGVVDASSLIAAINMAKKLVKA